VDITADGRTIVCGSPGDFWSEDRPGYVRVLKLLSDGDIGTNTWVQIGEAVSLSANGAIVVIGTSYACVNEICPGGAKVYQIDSAGSSWEKLGETIYAK